MNVVILAGGLGTRLSERTDVIPKPMVEIGGKPILWHIMRSYAAHGFDRFVVALGYKGEVIKDYFLNYHPLQSDVQVDLASGGTRILRKRADSNWRISLVDTGLNTMTGGRVQRLRTLLGAETFMLTYGDGVSDVNIRELYEFHRGHGKLATVTAVHPKTHYGELQIEDGVVKTFKEKPELRTSWINGGYMVLEPRVLDFIEDDSTVFERTPMERLADSGELMAFPHDGFWQCMDTLRDMRYLNELWERGAAPWKVPDAGR